MVVGSCCPDMEAVITMGGGGCWPRMDTFMVVWLLARHGSSHSNGWLLVSNGEVVWIGGSDIIFLPRRRARIMDGCRSRSGTVAVICGFCSFMRLLVSNEEGLVDRRCYEYGWFLVRN